MKRPHYMHVTMPAVLAYMRIRGLRLRIATRHAPYRVIIQPLVYGISVRIFRQFDASCNIQRDQAIENEIEKLSIDREDIRGRIKINIFYEEFESL